MKIQFCNKLTIASRILRPRLSQCRYFGKQISHHRVPGALALVALWVTAAAEVSACSDPSERMMIVWTFFGSEECGAGIASAGGGTDGAVSAGGATAGRGAASVGAIGTP
jgi:hypothetical protein